MIELIDTIKDEKIRASAIQRYREQGIILPTFAQMKDPFLIPDGIRTQLKAIGLWDLNPLNLFRITWHNEPKENGGGYGPVNTLELPTSLTGVDARIVTLIGKWFPTGAHKVGAAYGCLAPRIITGQFDPAYHKAVWPSTGNYCRGGAFDSYLMDCTAVAILPEEMSQERFDWLHDIGAEVIATPGCESNVKEIYDACDEIRRTREDCIIFNQFDEFGNACWHYHVTGRAIQEVCETLSESPAVPAAYISATGSAGTIAAGDYLRTLYPHIKIIGAEALQCPTLYNNGFGGHRIEGIGDKHVPWIHNVRNTDVISAIDDERCMRLLRLFNEPEGQAFLREEGVPDALVSQLHLLGISSIANICAAIKTARYFELDSHDVLITIATDAADLYTSRIEEMRETRGKYTRDAATRDYAGALQSITTDYYKELTYEDRKTIHNLKYFTWVEQQGKDVEDLRRLWYDKEIWHQIFAQPQKWDEMITDFNEEVGLADCI